jgi:hypothetical protein
MVSAFRERAGTLFFLGGIEKLPQTSGYDKL